MEQYSKMYHYDKIRINICKTVKELKRLLPIKMLKANCDSLQIGRASKPAQRGGFKSRIEPVMPNTKFFDILLSLGDALGTYVISKVEFAVDELYPGGFAAEMACEFKQKHTLMKYARHYLLYGKKEMHESDSAYKKRKKGVYSNLTFYSGEITSGCRLIIYARDSKAAKMAGMPETPCLHTELRIQGASRIRKLTGISSIADLKAFSIQEWLEPHLSNRTQRRKINHEKHGRFLLNKGSRASLKYKPGRGFSPIQASLIYCRLMRIDSAGELLSHYRKEKERIRSKRVRFAWEQRILDLSDHKLKSFLKPVQHVSERVLNACI